MITKITITALGQLIQTDEVESGPLVVTFGALAWVGIRDA